MEENKRFLPPISLLQVIMSTVFAHGLEQRYPFDQILKTMLNGSHNTSRKTVKSSTKRKTQLFPSTCIQGLQSQALDALFHLL